MSVRHMPGHLIRRLHQISTQTFARGMQAAGFDLTPVQFASLDAIRDNPGIDQAGVAQLIAYDRATIGGVIDRLVQKGYVSRTVSTRDRRARMLHLTEPGRAVLAAALPVVSALQADILPGLDPRERARLLELMRKAIDRAEACATAAER